MAVKQTTMIRASITAYSTAVGPSSETKKRCSFKAKDFIFSTAKRENATWRVELKDAERDTFTYKVTYYMMDGLQRSVGPMQTDERTLILEA